MTTTPEQIDLWRQAPSEHQRLEFKEAKSQFDTRKLCEYCVALANEGGGILLLGCYELFSDRTFGRIGIVRILCGWPSFDRNL